MKSHRLLPLVAAGFLLLGLSDTVSAQSRVDRYKGEMVKWFDIYLRK